MPEELYIGLVGIRAVQSSFILTEGKGAYTNLILFASSIEDYQIKAFDFFMQYGINIFEYIDIEIFEERKKKSNIDESLLEVADWVAENSEPWFGNLHTWDEENE